MRCRVSAIENPHIYGSGSKYISLGKLLHALDLIGEDGQDTMTMSTALFFCFFCKLHNRDTHNARIFIPMNTRTQTLPLGAYSKTVSANPQDWRSHHRRRSSRLTKSPQAPRCRRERRLPLKARTLLNPEKFAPTRSRTQNLRCYRGSRNH
jgi:hypothetical protein